MTETAKVGLLFARLQLAAPDARSVLLAPTRGSLDLLALGQELVNVMDGAGQAAELLDLRAAAMRDRERSMPERANVPSMVSVSEIQAPSPLPAFPTRTQVEEAVRRSGTYSVVVGDGLLDSPATIVAIPVVDAVVVAVQRGKTARADLERARREIQLAGGRAVGCVLFAH